MLRALRMALVFGALAVISGLSGCAAPCDRYCSTTAAYIERCLTDGSTEAWVAAKTSGFGYWGYADASEFEGDCKTDFDAQLAGAPDASIVQQACEDEANDFALLEDRGQCSELP